jgi:hypothetical protein
MTEPTIKQRQLQILDILKNFNFHPRVSSAVLESYCNRKGYEPITSGDYEDHLYQYQHDERARVIIPVILGVLQKYQYAGDYISDAERKRIKDENDALEVEIAKLCSENGIQYREIDIITSNFGEELSSTIKNAGTRMSNMCAVVISTIASDTFGKELTVKDMEEWHDQRSRELAGK